MLEFADKLGNKGKKKTVFSEQVLKQAHIVNDAEDPVKRSPQSLEELRKLVSKLNETHKKTSIARRTSDFLQPFFDGIIRYTGLVEILVSNDPAVSGLVWKGVKCVLQVYGFLILAHYNVDVNVI